jgi:hypothetical protein
LEVELGATQTQESEQVGIVMACCGVGLCAAFPFTLPSGLLFRGGRPPRWRCLCIGCIAATDRRRQSIDIYSLTCQGLPLIIAAHGKSRRTTQLQTKFAFCHRHTKTLTLEHAHKVVCKYGLQRGEPRNCKLFSHHTLKIPSSNF